MYSRSPQQASCLWFRASGCTFPQAASSKSNNILCVSVARADAARPRIETFLHAEMTLRQAGPDNRLSHTTEHFKMPFPKNTEGACETGSLSLPSAPVGGICGSRLTFMHEAGMEATIPGRRESWRRPKCALEMSDTRRVAARVPGRPC